MTPACLAVSGHIVAYRLHWPWLRLVRLHPCSMIFPGCASCPSCSAPGSGHSSPGPHHYQRPRYFSSRKVASGCCSTGFCYFAALHDGRTAD